MSALEKIIDKIFISHRWLVHSVFWLLVLFFYAVFFGRKSENYLQTFFFVGMLMPVTIGTTYFLNYFLVPRFLMEGRYGRFTLYFIYTLIGSLYLEMTISFITFIVIAKLQIHTMSPASIDIFFLMTSLLVVVFFGVAIKMLLHWRKSKEDYQRLMRGKVEAELKFLKLQLNPHFLFNTLNNLYYLATEKSEKTPQAILALSELLDYVLHDTKVDFVPLEKEIEQVKNYIALETLRYEDRLSLVLNVAGNGGSMKIPPMALITLTENAFKHGVMTSSGKAWIKIEIECSPDRILVQVGNSFNGVAKSDSKGIGLENLKGQLSLLYGNQFTFETSTKGNAFQAKLELSES